MTKQKKSSNERISLMWTGSEFSVPDYDITKVKERLVSAYKRMSLYIEKGYGKARVKTPFIYGAPGIGKTQLIKQVCDELGIGHITLDVQYYMPEDLVGAPDVVYTTKPTYDDLGNILNYGVGVTTQNSPVRLHETKKHKNGGILFLDELNRADGPLLTKMLNFINEGRIDSFELPPNWMIVAAGNRSTEGSNIIQLENETAFKRRFTFMNLVPDVENWRKWGRDTNKKFRINHGRDKMMPEVFDFILNNSDYFYKAYVSTEGAYPNPAAWADVANEILDEVEVRGLKSWRELDKRHMVEIYTENVGLDAANEIIKYFHVVEKFTEADFEQIIKEPQKAKIEPTVNTEPDTRFALIRFLFNMLATKIISFEADGIDVKEDPDVRSEVFHIYRNICEYFVRYNNLEQLIAAITEIIREYEFLSTTFARKYPTELEMVDMKYIQDNVEKVRVKTFSKKK